MSFIAIISRTIYRAAKSIVIVTGPRRSGCAHPCLPPPPSLRPTDLWPRQWIEREQEEMRTHGFR